VRRREGAGDSGSGRRRSRAWLGGSVVVLLATGAWVTAHGARLGDALHRRGAGEARRAPAAAPGRHAPVSSSATPVSGVAPPWLDRFSEWLHRPAADPGFYQALFAAGPGAVWQIGARLLDPTALEALRQGDLVAGMGGPALERRQDALLLLGELLADPQAPKATRYASADALAALVAAPIPGDLAPEAHALALHERGRALAALLRWDPRQGRAAWLRQEGVLPRALLRVEARKSLQDEGLPEPTVRSVLLALTPEGRG
jgi:hypothetical protein